MVLIFFGEVLMKVELVALLEHQANKIRVDLYEAKVKSVVPVGCPHLG